MCIRDRHKTSTPRQKNQSVLRLLGTKGPTAHLLFAKCLKEETTHTTHQELFQLITGEGNVEPQVSPVTRKRKASKDHHEVSVTKRVPDRLEIEGELGTKDYLKTIKKIRQCHNQGNWEAVDKLVEESANRSTEFHVAVLLESCTGLIIRKQRDKVIQTVDRARELCFKVDNNCKTHLLGRCDYTLARMHQYANEKDEALRCIMKARHVQYNIEFGEDTALTNHCHGCILLLDPLNAKEAEESLELAMCSSILSEEYGLDVAHPKIRLIQLYLGSSSHCPGTKKDSDSLTKAQSSLNSLAQKLDTLALRTQCICLYTQSDLYSNRGELKRARSSAQRALAIAEANRFTTEMESASIRLSQMEHTQ